MGTMPISVLAGQPAPPNLLVNVPRLITAYYTGKPDVAVAAQRVAFGTSGHRGSSFDCAFNEDHILAITQAICEHRHEQGVDGPLFLAKDTHGLSEPAFASALEVLAANGVEVMVDADLGYTPTPTLSHAILVYNRGRKTGLSDGIVITPSHNPPEDGGFKYNPPEGGPADTTATNWIENRANAILADGLALCAARPTPRRWPPPPRTGTITFRNMSTTWKPPWTWPPCATRIFRWGPIRWAARAWPTGPASPSATA